MTNYTIEILKKEESRLADCIDILNAMGVEESTPEKLGLTTARDSVKEALEVLENKPLDTSNVDLMDFRWERFRDSVMDTVKNLDKNQATKECKSSATNTSISSEKLKCKKEAYTENSCNKAVKFALSLLDKTNREGRTATRLHLVDNGHVTTVEDFSSVCHVDCMSTDLMDALKNGRTLTKEQKVELDSLIAEVVVEI